MRQTLMMDTRKLRMVKPSPPAIGVCQGCNSQFKTNKRLVDEVEIGLGCFRNPGVFAADGSRAYDAPRRWLQSCF
jgi:hypothetical protein